MRPAPLSVLALALAAPSAPAAAAAFAEYQHRIFLGELYGTCEEGSRLNRTQCLETATNFFYLSDVLTDQMDQSYPKGCFWRGGGSMGTVYYNEHSEPDPEAFPTGNPTFPLCLRDQAQPGVVNWAFQSPTTSCATGYQPLPFPHQCKQAAEELFNWTWAGTTASADEVCGCMVRTAEKRLYWNFGRPGCEAPTRGTQAVCWPALTLEGDVFAGVDPGTEPLQRRYHKVHDDRWCGETPVFDCYEEYWTVCQPPSHGLCDAGTTMCTGDIDLLAHEKCGCDGYRNGASAGWGQLCASVEYKFARWLESCAPYHTRPLCEQKCDETPGCNYMVWGWNPAGTYYRCAGFTSCDNLVSYDDGAPKIYVSPSVFEHNEATAQLDDGLDWYRREPGVGQWGGTCRCPNDLSKVYWVGDRWDFCATLACENGIPGPCVPSTDHVPVEFQQHKVTCSPIPQCLVKEDDVTGCHGQCGGGEGNCGVTTTAALDGSPYVCQCGSCGGCPPAPWMSVL